MKLKFYLHPYAFRQYCLGEARCHPLFERRSDVALKFALQPHELLQKPLEVNHLRFGQPLSAPEIFEFGHVDRHPKVRKSCLQNCLRFPQFFRVGEYDDLRRLAISCLVAVTQFLFRLILEMPIPVKEHDLGLAYLGWDRALS